jgi:flap endonuclease-1
LGVNLRDLFRPERRSVPDAWYEGKRVAIDGYNVAYRYLAASLGADLHRNKAQRPIGHLLGYLHVVRFLRERGAQPIVVWDGPVHPLKRATVESRIARRLEASLNAEEALAAGDMAAYEKHLRGTIYIDGAMVRDCTRLLEALGVPVVVADHDAERYAAALCQAGHADAVATEDYDALVAGAPVVVRKAGSAQAFFHGLEDLDPTHELDTRKLRWVAILCGTDWNPGGVKGLGAKTAVRLLREYPDLPALVQEAAQGMASTRYHAMVRDSGLTPEFFQQLDEHISTLPKVDAPTRPKPDPALAAQVADEFHLDRKRTMACFC